MKPATKDTLFIGAIIGIPLGLFLWWIVNTGNKMDAKCREKGGVLVRDQCIKKEYVIPIK